MMADWENVELGSICEVVRGGSPRPIIDYITDEPDGVNWLKIGDVKETDKFFTHANEKIKPSGIPKTREVKAGDLILSNSMSFGRAFITLIDGYIHDGWLRLRCDESKLDKEYLYYFLTSNLAQNQFKAIATGSVVNNLKSDTVKAVKIALPTLGEQKRIAEVLSMFDDKIKCNEEVNKNLLEQVRALYKDRFIDLMPFGGSMPSDWHLGTVSEIIELHDSKRIPLSSRERAELDKIYPYYGATSVMDYVDRYLFDGIYLLLGEDGTVVDGQGFPILQYVEGKFWVNNHAHIITGKNGFTVELLYLLFSLTNVQSIVTGAVQPKISQANLNKVPIVIPSEAELKAFDESIQPFFAEIRNLRAENDRLATVRDSILPRLMSGELDVSDLDF